MGCAVSDDNADQLVQQRFREGRTLKSAAFLRFGLPFHPSTPEEIDMTDATHPFDALMEITARPPVVFVRGAGSYLWDDSAQALSRLRAGLGRQRARPFAACRCGSACRAGQAAADAEPRLLQRPQPEACARRWSRTAASIRSSSPIPARKPMKAPSSSRGNTARNTRTARSKSSPSKAAFTAARSPPCRRRARRRSSRCSSRKYRASAKPSSTTSIQ